MLIVLTPVLCSDSLSFPLKPSICPRTPPGFTLHQPRLQTPLHCDNSSGFLVSEDLSNLEECWSEVLWSASPLGFV